MAGRQGRREFGAIRTLPSGRHQASYVGPDGRRHAAPKTFGDKDAARLWLRDERRLVEESAESWRPPKERLRAAHDERKRKGLTFGEYAETWLSGRRTKNGQPLAARTAEHYRRLLDEHLLPTFGVTPLREIEPEDVDAWHARTLPHAPTMRAHSYGLLRTILGTAASRRLIRSNPATIVGAGNTERARNVRPASIEELAAIVEHMPEQHRLMVLLAAWCSLRFGELAEIRRSDFDTKAGVIHVRRGVVRVKGAKVVKDPKTAAGRRDVAMPPHLVQMVREHRLAHAEPTAGGLMFPAKRGGQLAPSAFYGRASEYDDAGELRRQGWGWYEARRAAGREDLRFHDLRGTGATWAAQAGATLAELMHRLGHTTAGAAMRYQHSTRERDAEIARRLSLLADASEQAPTLRNE